MKATLTPSLQNLPRVRAMGEAALRYHQAQEDDRQRNIHRRQELEEMNRQLDQRHEELRQRYPERFPAPLQRPIPAIVRPQVPRLPAGHPRIQNGQWPYPADRYHINGIGVVEVPRGVPPRPHVNAAELLRRNRPQHQPAGDGQAIHPELLQNRGVQAHDDHNDHIVRIGRVAAPRAELHLGQAAAVAQRAEIIDLTHD